MKRRDALRWFTAGALASCSRSRRDERNLVFLHQPLFGNTAPFVALLDEFRRAHPAVPLIARSVPSASDVLHQVLLTTLEGDSDVDVIVSDGRHIRAGLPSLRREVEMICAGGLIEVARTAMAAQ